MEKWVLKKRSLWPSDISNQFKTDALLSELLARRGLSSLDEVREYLLRDDSMEHSPFLLKDMDTAVQMIRPIIEQKKKILFSLDYDVDGIISGAIAQLGFSKLGAVCESIFPHRVTDGYGLNKRIVQYALENDFSCIITFDNGIAAFDAINFAKENGLTVIVTDHHEIPMRIDGDIEEELFVSADAIINPKQKSCRYPFKSICGAMIAYKLLQATNQELGYSYDNISDLYPLVTIATICDVMPLVDENRVFVYHGLKQLPNTNNIGLSALLSSLQITREPNTYDVGFKIGPCFNSSGRLASAQLAFDLLTTQNPMDAEQFSRELVELNDERKKMTQEATIQAFDLIKQQNIQDRIIVITLEDVHESLAGIVAGRVKEKFSRGAIVFTKVEDYYKGSARSSDNVNIFELLSKFKDRFYKFGGHAAAAGLTIKEDQFDSFCQDFQQYCNSLDINNEKIYYVDQILLLDQLNIRLALSLDIFEPTGKENPPLLFSSLDLTIIKLERLGKEGKVLKIEFEKDGARRSFVSFDESSIIPLIKNKMNLSQEYDIIASLPSNIKQTRFDILYKVGINHYQNNEYLNLEIVSIR